MSGEQTFFGLKGLKLLDIGENYRLKPREKQIKAKNEEKKTS